MKEEEIVRLPVATAKANDLARLLQNPESRVTLKGLCGSATALFLKNCFEAAQDQTFLLLLSDKEKAAFLYHDLEILSNEENKDSRDKQVLFFPSSYKKHADRQETDAFQTLLRAQTVAQLGRPLLIISYPEAVCEKEISAQNLEKDSLKLHVGENVPMDEITGFLSGYDFEYSDYVCQPGDYAVRGGIIDLYSFLDEHPYRIAFDGDSIQSIRQFDIHTQASIRKVESLTLIGKTDMDDPHQKESLPAMLAKLTDDHGNLSNDKADNAACRCTIWLDDLSAITSQINDYKLYFNDLSEKSYRESFLDESDFLHEILHFPMVFMAGKHSGKITETITFNTIPQDSFNKNFDLLVDQWIEHYEKGITNYFGSDNANQRKRIRQMIAEILQTHPKYSRLSASEREIYEKEMVRMAGFSLHEGFTDKEDGIAFYTDHQVFNRYHRYRIEDKFQNKDALLLKDLYSLQIGDYITHIDHGVGQFAGLEKMEVNGHPQEVIKLLYQNNDTLYISIHSLHKISKYSGKDGLPPTLSRLGSNHWNKIKERTKEKVKEMVIDLTRLYAERKNAEGFAFSQDTYLQQELEASFMYEDTPDQLKATREVKKDMEADFPMDRLICGDVGFGKTEVAIRAAFKAVCDSKQVAVLVPTTVLALQHFHSFSDRLQAFPCKIAYLNRFTTAKMKKQILEEVSTGKIDILIGTHKILGKEIQFKDLGLLVIDEEQKFGVEAKEKLRSLKVNVDTLTMTATPIPRTLQFSLMGARDISIIQTPPLNRHPVQTEVHTFDETFIKEGISQEISRGGQVFFVHNRVQTLSEVAGMIQRNFPEQRIAVAHGQMEGNALERIMIDFIDGMYDILVCTTIIESGLDIPNANTIFINEAQNYGLSDLHQLRGRVGRKNKKAFCYLLAPPLHTLPETSQKRLRAIEEFSDIGSGFHIAMRDLDIRGAGNLLGAEQSGFITEIGYEMYQKILEEAIVELNNTSAEMQVRDDISYVKDCTLETDLEVLIPDSYIGNSNERLILYKEMNSLKSEEEIPAFQARMEDRFGPLPPPTVDLFNSLKLRWLAKEIGFEKVVLKQQRMTGYFVMDEHSAYYESEQFQHILQYLQQHPQQCRMKEEPGKLTLTLSGIPDVKKALEKMRELKYYKV